MELKVRSRSVTSKEFANDLSKRQKKGRKVNNVLIHSLLALLTLILAIHIVYSFSYIVYPTTLLLVINIVSLAIFSIAYVFFFIKKKVVTGVVKALVFVMPLLSLLQIVLSYIMAVAWRSRWWHVGSMCFCIVAFYAAIFICSLAIIIISIVTDQKSICVVKTKTIVVESNLERELMEVNRLLDSGVITTQEAEMMRTSIIKKYSSN